MDRVDENETSFYRELNKDGLCLVEKTRETLVLDYTLRLIAFLSASAVYNQLKYIECYPSTIAIHEQLVSTIKNI